ncbi:hypothetical protein QUF61_11365 [Candidatus Venteria ishoeyi]|uniref:tetratricopeptide repeat protein n=1 Tax=Candidatus Venteria ishoeyi TaxID=1899563 RepID=UPI0025A53CEE|nr:hypothetical protein [Candidatus Venteria ishoeyi]MDM8547083.1 hypothetical protein [Candidatus Venteria ishoeyi]
MMRFFVILIFAYTHWAWATENLTIEKQIQEKQAQEKQLQALQVEVVKHPGASQPKIQLAQYYIQRGRQQQNPAYFANARALLKKIRQKSPALLALLMLRGQLLHYAHQFDSALKDLDIVIAKDKGNKAQAEILKSVIYRHQGKYEQAYKICAKILESSNVVFSSLCYANLYSRTGQSKRAYRELESVQANALLMGKAFEHLLNAEMAVIHYRQHYFQGAEQAFNKALKTGGESLYLLTWYADYLLDRGKVQQVLQQLPFDHAHPRIQLRRALALTKTGKTTAQLKNLKQMLRERFAQAFAAKDFSLLTAEARFLLELEQQAGAALSRAQTAWKNFKEPETARIYLQALLELKIQNQLEADAQSAAETMISWIKQQRWEDPILNFLIHAYRDKDNSCKVYTTSPKNFSYLIAKFCQK